MKKFYLILTILSLFLLSSLSIASASNDLQTAAIKKLQESIIKALPVESNIVRIGVLDLEGDDGTIREAITSAITEKTTYKVMERQDLDKLLQEQGLQLKDVMDEKTRIQPGRIKGVQGLLLGKVVSMEKGFMAYSLKVQLKLDDVEKGEIVFSKDFNISVASPARNWIFLGIIGLAVLVLLIVFLKKRRVTVIKTKIQEDVRERVDITKEIGKALTNLSQAKAKLMDQNKTEEAIRLKDAERELLLLKEQVDNAARGSADLHLKKDFKQALEFDRKMKGNCENLSKSADRIYSLALSGDRDALIRETDTLTREVKNTRNEFQGRGF